MRRRMVGRNIHAVEPVQAEWLMRLHANIA